MRKSTRRISPEPVAADGAVPIPQYSEEQDLQETINIQARAIREMTTSLERASTMMETQTHTFSKEMDLLKQQIKQQVEEEAPLEEEMVDKESIADAVDAAAFMSELDEMILSLQSVGQTKSLPAIVKHLLTLFRFVFPAQLVEFYVLDSYSDTGAFWSMSCRTEHLDDTSSVTFSDISGETLDVKLLAKVRSSKSSVVIKDSVFDASKVDTGESDKMNEVSSSTATAAAAGGAAAGTTDLNSMEQQQLGTNKKKKKTKRQSFMSSSTKSHPVVTKFMSELSDPAMIEEWKEVQQHKMDQTRVQSGVVVPIMDSTHGGGFDQSFGVNSSGKTQTKSHAGKGEGQVLAIFQIVNRIDPLEGDTINFSNKDIELLKLFLGRCKIVFRQTRTLTGLLSAARRRHGNISSERFITHAHKEGKEFEQGLSALTEVDEGNALRASSETKTSRNDPRKESDMDLRKRISLEQQISQ